MADLTLPVRSDLPNYSFKTTLEETVYIFSFRWNARFGRWIMDIADSEGVDIINGIPININADLIGRFQYKGALPPGQLTAINIEDEFAEPTRDNFGTNIIMFYRESA